MASIKSLLQRGRPWSWILWHPHEGLWNWRLLRAFQLFLPARLFRLMARLIIFVDTVILLFRALGRRVTRIGPLAVVGMRKSPLGIPVLYFDLGTHKEARELRWMVDEILPQICDDFRAFAFEASRESYELARRRFAGRDNVTFVHGALCQMLPDDNKIRLYKDGRNGLGNSVLKHNFAEYEEVDAIRLSEWMQEQQLNLENSVCLLRMNIEGSEFDVISDLVNGGLHKFIDGYFGMWDDLSKIDKRRDDEFRALLARNNIRPFTFNGRDLGSNFRLKCIRYDIDTSVRVGLRRLGKSPNKGAGSE